MELQLSCQDLLLSWVQNIAFFNVAVNKSYELTDNKITISAVVSAPLTFDRASYLLNNTESL